MLECFWDLVSSEPDKRQQAEYTLLTGLRTAQANHQQQGLAPDVDYAVKRLVRGLSSSTEAARQGFAACLSEALHELPEIPLFTVYNHMKESTEVTGSVRGQEERDMLFGRLFTCLVVARSGRLKQEPEDEDGKTNEVCRQLFDTALSIFTKKKVLRTLAAEALVAIVHDIPPQAFLDYYGPKLTEALGGVDAKAQDYNPDQLLVALEIQKYLTRHGLRKKDEEQVQGKVPSELLGKVLCKPKRVARLLEPLKASSSAFPHIHPVWDSVLEVILGEGWVSKGVIDLGAKREDMLNSLWTTVVEGCLAVGTEERKALSMFLLQRLVPHLSSSALPLILSPHLLHCLTTVLASNSAEQHLKPLAAHALEQSILAVQSDPERRLALACSLLSRGDVNFDKRTNTKAVSRLLEGLASDAVEKFIKWLSQVVGGEIEVEVEEEDDEEEEVKRERDAKRRAWAVDGLYALAKNSVQDEGVLRQLIRLLLSLGFFDASGVKKKSKKGKKANTGTALEKWILVTTPDLPKEVRTVSSTRFMSLMADITTGPLVFQSGKGSLDWLWAAHESWKELEEAGAELVEGLGEEATEARGKMLGVVEGIRAKLVAGEGDKLGAAIAAVLMQVGLLQLVVVGGEEEEACGEMLLDLCQCHEHLMVGDGSKGKKAKKKKDQKGNEEDQDLPDPLAVLADVCVGSLSLQGGGAVMRGVRDIVKKSWGLVCGSKGLNKAALEVIINAVCPPAAVEGDDEDEDLMEEDDDDDDDDDDEGSGSDDEKELSNVKASQGPGPKGKEKPKAGAKEKDEDEEEEEEDIMLSLDDEEELLRVLGGDSKDEEGAASLQNILSLRQQSRKAGKLEVEKARLQHRLRSLDLLEAFATKQHSSGLLLLSLLPVVTTIRPLSAQTNIPEAQALASRLRTYITKTLAGKARPKISSDDSEVTMEEVQTIALAISTRLSKAKAPVAGYASLLTCALTCCLRAALSPSSGSDEASVVMPEWLIDLYRSSLDDLMTKRHGPPPSIFDEFILRFPTPACQALLVPLARYLGVATKSFRRAEACRLISSLLFKRKSLADSAKDELLSTLPDIAKGLAQALGREEEGDNAGKAKRVKPVLQCTTALMATLNDPKLEASHAVPAATLALIAQGLEKTASTTQSDGIKKTCTSLVASVRKLSGGTSQVAPSSGKERGNKRKATESVAAEEKPAGKKEKADKGKKGKAAVAAMDVDNSDSKDKTEEGGKKKKDNKKKAKKAGV